MTVAIDAMGGDYGVSVVVPAALTALKNNPSLHLILVGDQSLIDSCLYQNKAFRVPRLQIHHASEVVQMDESPSSALRNKKDSSMRVAINLVHDKTAQACVSAGNTGALMATARFVLKTLPGIDRPAIMTSLPTMIRGKEVRVLDLGANIDSTPENLFEFAVMSKAVISATENNSNPKVALLNIGEEEIKGNELIKKTAQLLKESHYINYVGYVEGHMVFSGEVDIVICDGFIGNVALKISEGVARLIGHYLKQIFFRNFYSKMVALLAKPLLNSFKRDLDPGRRNGASLLGLQGIVIKSHGGANIQAFTHAIEEAMRQVENNIPEKIREEVAQVLDQE